MRNALGYAIVAISELVVFLIIKDTKGVEIIIAFNLAIALIFGLLAVYSTYRFMKHL